RRAGDHRRSVPLDRGDVGPRRRACGPGGRAGGEGTGRRARTRGRASGVAYVDFVARGEAEVIHATGNDVDAECRVYILPVTGSPSTRRGGEASPPHSTCDWRRSVAETAERDGLLPMARPVTILDLQKMRDEGRPITMVTAYDYPTAKMADEAGVDLIL